MHISVSPSKMTANFNPHDKDHQMALISHQFFPVGLYNQAELGRPQGEVVIKPRKRRKKNKGEGGIGGLRLKKRKLSQDQVNFLELNFGDEHKLESERKDRLASELGLDPRQVAVWFQNRRARWKSKKLEEEYSKLKAEYEATVVHKCRLETEVLKLKGQLSEAEKEKQRLLELIRCDGVSTNSPMSSSLSVEAIHPPFFGEFGMQGLENILCVPENSYSNGMEWINLI